MKKKLIYFIALLFAFTWQSNAQYLSEDFEGGTLPSGWSQEYVSGTSDYTYQNGGHSGNPANAHSGSYNALFYVGNYNGDATKLVTPSIDLSGATSPQLSFWHAQVDWAGDQDELRVYYKTSASGTWTLLQEWTNSISSWTKETINLPNLSSDYYIAFEATSGYGYGVVIDDVVIQEPPSCLDPTDLVVNNVGETTADVSWTDNNSGNSTYTVEWREAGSSGAWSSDTTAQGATSYQITGLNSNTEYEWQVTADCGADGTSQAVAGPNFTTLCSVLPTPFNETFEDTSNSLSCWSNETTSDQLQWYWQTGATASSNTGPDSAHGGTYYVYVESSGSNNGDTAVMYSPRIDLSGLTTPRLNFFYHMYGAGMDPDGSIDVDISTDSGATYTNIFHQEGNHGNQWNQGLVDLSSYSGTVMFRVTGTVSSTGTTYQNDFAIDDFAVEETPSCPEPTGLDASNITDTQADLSWTAGGSENQWNIEYGVTGFTQGQGTVVNGVTNPYTLTGLTDNTDYDYYVQADCGGSTSTWVGPYTFHTGYCVSDPTSNDGNGISQVVLGSETFSIPDVTYQYNDTPVVNLQAGTTANLLITFETGYTYNTNVWIDLNDDFQFDSSELLYQGESTSDNPTTLDASFPLDANAAQGQHRMRIGTADSGQATPNPCYNGSYGVTLDFEVNITPPPSCPDPSGLTASNITDTQADLSWTAGGSETQWNIEWGVTGFTQGSGTMVNGVTNNPYTLTGLTTQTTYDYYVQADCGGGDASNWVGPYTFTTTPVNNLPAGAIDLAVGSSCNFATYSNTGATDSGEGAPGCGGYNGADVWFKFTAPSNAIRIDSNTGDITDGAMAVYSGTPGNLTLIECNDDSSANGLMPMIERGDYVPGDTYYVRFWEYGGNTFGTFDICVATACDITIVPTYLEDFTNYDTNCWTEGNGPASGPTNYNDSNWTDRGFARIGTTGSASINMYNGDDRAWLISPEIDLSAGNYTLSVDVAVTHWKHPIPETMGEDDQVILKYSDDGGSTWQDIYTWDASNQPSNTGDTFVYDLSNYTSSTAKFAFWANEGSDERHSYIFFVDNFLIKAMDANCSAPTDLAVSTSGTDATFTWTDNSSGSADYTVEWREALTTNWNSANAGTGVTTYTVNGLSPGTEYEWRLLYDCGNGAGAIPVDGTNFIVGCDPIVPDYMQDFSTYLPDCWREGNGGVDKPANFNDSGWKDMGFARVGSSGSAAFNMYNGNDRDWLISPQFDLTGGTYELTVDVAVTHWAHPTPENMGPDDEVVLKYSTDGGNTWMDLVTWNAQNQPSHTGDNVTVDLANVTGDHVMFAFWANEGQDDRHSYLFFVDNFSIHSASSSRPSANNILVGQDENKFTVKSINDKNMKNIYVYDISGRLIYTRENVNENLQEVWLHVPQGTVLIFNIDMQNGDRIVKKAIKK